MPLSADDLEVSRASANGRLQHSLDQVDPLLLNPVNDQGIFKKNAFKELLSQLKANKDALVEVQDAFLQAMKKPTKAEEELMVGYNDKRTQLIQSLHLIVQETEDKRAALRTEVSDRADQEVKDQAAEERQY